MIEKPVVDKKMTCRQKDDLASESRFVRLNSLVSWRRRDSDCHTMGEHVCKVLPLITWRESCADANAEI